MKPNEIGVVLSPGGSGDPNAPKLLRLGEIAESLGFRVDRLDCRHVPDPDERVRLLREAKSAARHHLILAGFSMGGYVSAAAAETLCPLGLFLVAPALYLPPCANLDPSPQAKLIQVVHGRHDELVPPENSRRFAERWGAELHRLDGDHSLQDQLPQVGSLFERFLAACLRISAATSP